jgi:hypothetical protein
VRELRGRGALLLSFGRVRSCRPIAENRSARGAMSPVSLDQDLSAPSVFTLIRPKEAYAMLYYAVRLNSSLEAQQWKAANS